MLLIARGVPVAVILQAQEVARACIATEISKPKRRLTSWFSYPDVRPDQFKQLVFHQRSAGQQPGQERIAPIGRQAGSFKSADESTRTFH